MLDGHEYILIPELRDKDDQRLEVVLGDFHGLISVESGSVHWWEKLFYKERPCYLWQTRQTKMRGVEKRYGKEDSLQKALDKLCRSLVEVVSETTSMQKLMDRLEGFVNEVGLTEEEMTASYPL